MATSLIPITRVHILKHEEVDDIYEFENWLPIHMGLLIYIFDTCYKIASQAFSIEDIQIAEDTYRRTGVLILYASETQM